MKEVLTAVFTKADLAMKPEIPSAGKQACYECKVTSINVLLQVLVLLLLSFVKSSLTISPRGSSSLPMLATLLLF
jgi:hypothetical protein